MPSAVFINSTLYDANAGLNRNCEGGVRSDEPDIWSLKSLCHTHLNQGRLKNKGI
jgi:hypothetical protein